MTEKTDHLSELHRRTTSPSTPCPDSDHLAALAAGEAWPWRRRRITRHLSECPHCADEYRTVLAARDGLRDALGAAGPGSARSWLSALIPAGAAAGLAAVLIVALSPNPQSGSTPDAPRIASAPASDTLFASNFDNGHPAAESTSDTLFQSDFGGPGSPST